ncbi:MAG: methyl-accepting chemotaxis protein, partial [Gammaproteobacteria bacterium]
SINEITASLEEIEKSSAQTNEKAKTLGETAERTRTKGQQGLEAVEQSINGMKMVRDKVQMIAQTILDLSNQTQQVGEITSVVNNLAQQSKMLALNASIEAVKAGDAGKGFSVVATEVRNLAEQSEQSTIQVQKILENIRHTAEKAVMVTEEGTKGVDFGTNLVEQTGEIVKSLTEVIYETAIATQQIEAAVRQESVGIEQITIGMNEINQVTSSFVASTKQTMEAIESLSGIAKSIKEYIDIYKV